MKTLVIDDDEDYAFLIKYYFENQGEEVLIANTVHQGIKQAIDENPDIIICDLFLPLENGFQVMKRLLHFGATKHIPIFILTGFDERGLERLSQIAGSYKYISKDVGIKEIYRICTLKKL